MYTVDYFIKKFEAIPEELWCAGLLVNSSGARCAIGWCRQVSYCPTDESEALHELTLKYLRMLPSQINDGRAWGHFEQATPKRRILAALYKIKKLMGEEPGTVTIEEILTPELEMA